MTKKLAIISTHPIQYYAPVFQLLARQLDLKVFYTWGEQSLHKYDKGFKQHIAWDIPLLEGYAYTFLKNMAKDPGTHHFRGIVNPDLISEVQSYGPDAVLVYGWAWQSHLKAMRFFKGRIPVYFRGDSTLLNKSSGLAHSLKRLFLRWVYRHVDLAFYVGTANKAYFKAFGLKEHQLVFAPHAIDNDRFGADRQDEAVALRTKLGIAASDVLILFAGKLEPIKNPQLLLTAFKELALENVQLLFVGNGVLESTLKASKNSNIHFLDFQNQTMMPVVYQACDLCCLPSQNESWGLAINEAMAAGRAVLASSQVSCGIDLISQENGAIFKCNDLIDLKQKLIALTSKKECLQQMGENSSKKITHWSFQKQAKAISSYVNR
ncbi:glycosyltransferase family 4 protein [Pedobacter sp. ASV12]|uniref:glycosyltransferase family 4 protein n=1 Tax=Pedobacter sp. ASV12 TaxID=2795120 RepID=UPI001E4D0921|nr:glycosyltransferase family 4 protein [Pedobacter sp. ASV12]